MRKGLLAVCVVLGWCICSPAWATQWLVEVQVQGRPAYEAQAASSRGMSDIAVYDRRGHMVERFRGSVLAPAWQGWRLAPNGQPMEPVQGTVLQGPGLKRIDLVSSSGRFTFRALPSK